MTSHHQAKRKRPAIVLCRNVTGLATLRALSAIGVEVHCLMLEAASCVRFSRFGKKVPAFDLEKDEPSLLRFLVDYCERLEAPPIVLPTSDSTALFLARHAAELRKCCDFSSTTYEELLGIVSKDVLYHRASIAGVATVPSIVAADPDAVANWSLHEESPYLLKPFYESIDTPRAFGNKNIVLPSRGDLLNYLAEHGAHSIIVQRLISGGDGNIFDCYGYCSSDGQIVTMASHRRLRQEPPDFGTTCYGEIPANFGAEAEATIFSSTEKLLASINFHGIFGIEWLHERSTGKFYLIDFNARPFLTIGHLHACGLNLPALAYLELVGDLPAKIERRPNLRHILWMDLIRDLVTLRAVNSSAFRAFFLWAETIWRCRSFAYSRWNDPGPGIYRLGELALKLLLFSAKPAIKKTRDFWASLF